MNRPEGNATDTDIVRTVGELIERLSALPSETLVLATWEGVFETIGVARELYEGRVILVAEEIGRQWFGPHTEWDGAISRRVESGWY